jgi:hypothetical protein
MDLGERRAAMIDRILERFFGGIDTFNNWIFGWMQPRCQCNINNCSGNKCKRCGCRRKKVG